MSSGLPIEAALPALREALGTRRAAVLQAPPGVGKSTVVPLALLGEPWAAHKRLLMLEPRRLATRSIAQRMAHTLGEPLGATVGYRMRLETRVSRATRIEVVTEGVLGRMLQDDPALEGVAALLFDEFHERSLTADLGLALALDARAHLTPELRVLVMSATLDGEAVAQLLGGAPIITAPGSAFAVETRYCGRGAPVLPEGAPAGESPEKLIARLVRRALAEQEGDLLVFLPGAREIRRVETLLAGETPPGVRVQPLYGELAGEAQDAALAPAGPGTRKVVLATNIAETSLTIPGVRAVIDSGLVRRALFDPATGMTRLETRRISRASAEQRRGRAGRVAPGICYRAWSEGAHASLAAFTAAEILEADLAPLALELAAWGVSDEHSLAWLDPPPAAQLASARELLSRLGALDRTGRITAHGRAMAGLPVHPRLAHMLLRAAGLGSLALAALLAALLSERDLLRGPGGARDADIRARLALFEGSGGEAAGRAALERTRRAARQLERRVQEGTPAPAQSGSAADPGLLLAFAYPDRIGLRRSGPGGRFALTNGRGAAFTEAQALGRQELIVAVELDDRERDAHILLAAPVARAPLLQHFADRITRRDLVAWDPREQAVMARRTLELDALTLEDKPLADVPPETTLTAMLAGVRELGLAALPWDRETRELQARIEFLRGAPGEDARWPRVGDADLAASLDAWLAPWLGGMTRRGHLARLPLAAALRSLLSFEQQRALEERAPPSLRVPSGSLIRIEYQGEGAPAVAVRLQEVFGLEATPRIDRGRVALTFRLLSPAQRPVQVTRDLASFWRGAYAEVRRDLRGRYPKHYWPENPLEARPTRGARRRS